MNSPTARMNLWAQSMTPEAAPIEITHQLAGIRTRSMPPGTRAVKFKEWAADLKSRLEASHAA